MLPFCNYYTETGTNPYDSNRSRDTSYDGTAFQTALKMVPITLTETFAVVTNSHSRICDFFVFCPSSASLRNLVHTRR